MKRLGSDLVFGVFGTPESSGPTFLYACNTDGSPGTSGPFLVEDELKRVGGLYEKAPDWQSFAITDGRLITGQNSAWSTFAARALLKLFAEVGA